jgi:hypothetical protein
MKFLPTVDLWDQANIAAIEAGTLRLQCGQWVKAGCDTFKSRLHNISFRNGEVNHIRAFHGPRAAQKFMAYCRNSH